MLYFLLCLQLQSLHLCLQSSCSSDDDNDWIPQEELSAIYDPIWGQRRELLREEIRSRFNDLVLRSAQTNQSESDPRGTPICLRCMEDSELCQQVPKVPLGSNHLACAQGNKENVKTSQLLRPGGTSKTSKGQGTMTSSSSNNSSSSKRYKGKNPR